MKTAKSIIKYVLLFIIGALSGLTVYLVDDGDVALLTYVEETLVPNAVLALSSVGGLSAAAYPIISKVEAVLLKFGIATEKVNNVANNGAALAESDKLYKEEIRAELSKYQNKLEEICSLFTNVKDELMNEEKAIEDNEERIVEMLILAFCNTDELVKKGYAKEIIKIAEELKNGNTEGTENEKAEP